MAYRIWLFFAGIAGGTAIMAAAYGAHGLAGITTFSPMVKIYDTATLYHALHAIALALTAVLLAATGAGQRRPYATFLLNLAAAAFLIGILLFSGGIYFHISRGLQSVAPVVPVGGIAFMVGWAALALSALGLGTPVNQAPD